MSEPTFPRRLVELVRNELREFSADDPDVGDLLDQDANRILSRLADAGVELPADPEPSPEWRVIAEASGVCLRDASNESKVSVVSITGDHWASVALAERVASHLNGECVRTEEADTDGEA